MGALMVRIRIWESVGRVLAWMDEQEHAVTHSTTPSTVDGPSWTSTRCCAEPLRGGGPTELEYDPYTGEWVRTRGEGFVLAPLWESRSLYGVSYEEWHDVVDGGDLNAMSLVAALTRRWGAPRTVVMRPVMFQPLPCEPMPPVLEALSDVDNYGDLTVWGPVPAGPGGAARWVGVSVKHCDEKAPLVLMAVVADREIVEWETPL